MLFYPRGLAIITRNIIFTFIYVHIFNLYLLWLYTIELVLINLRYNYSRTVVATCWPTEFAFTFVGH